MRDNCMTIAGFPSVFVGFLMGAVVTGSLVGTVIAMLVVPLLVVLIVKDFFRRVVARPEGLEVDGKIVPWAKTSEPEISGRHARIVVTHRDGTENVGLFFPQIEEIDAVTELRARALFSAPPPPHLGPYR